MAGPWEDYAATGPWSDFAASKPKKKPKGYTHGWARSLVQGASLGLADEYEGLKAGRDKLVENTIRRVAGKPVEESAMDAFRNKRDDERRQQKEFSAAHPKADLGLQILGGFLTPGAGAAGGFVKGAKSTAGAVGRSALTGAAYGAAAGAGHSEEGERVKGALEGAKYGAVVGGALPIAGKAIKVGARALNAATGQRFGGPGSAAAARLTDALKRDGVDEAKIAEALEDWSQAGNEAPSLLDVAGSNTLRLIRGAASKEGPAQNVAEEYALTTRTSAAGRGMKRADALAPDAPSAEAFREGVLETRSKLASEQYAAPYQERVPVTPQVLSALSDEPGKAALRRARSAAVSRRNQQQVEEIDALLSGDVSEVSAGTLDRIKIAMGKRGETLNMRPDTRDIAGGMFERAKDIDESLAKVDALKPARETYANLSGQIEASKVGEAILKMRPDEFAKGVADLSPEGKRAALVGVRSALVDSFGDRVTANGKLDDLAYAEDLKANLTALLGEKEASRMIRWAQNEARRVKRASMIAPSTGSQTDPRGQERGLLGVVDAVRRPVDFILDKLAAGLTITERERELLVKAGIKPDARGALSGLTQGQRRIPGPSPARAVPAAGAFVGSRQAPALESYAY